MLIAHSIQVMRCTNPRCGALHICMMDEDGECFAQAILPVTNIPAFVADLEQSAAEVGGEAPQEGHA